MNSLKMWLITAQTNLHVGNENTTSYGIIDKEVQRDALTNLPCINSGSLKGALNEFATQSVGLSPEVRLATFGSDKTNVEKSTKKGNHIFMDANLLILPKQCDRGESGLFKLVTCKASLNLLVDRLNNYNIKTQADSLKQLLVEEVGANISLLGIEGVHIIEDNEFRGLCDDLNLPIIARNCLVQGKENLWYEQVVPSQSVFYTFIDDAGYKEENKEDKTLVEALRDDSTIVQIGANGSIGYGFCKFKECK